jgi:hypothetical protein
VAWAHWCRGELFHTDAINSVGLENLAQTVFGPLPIQVPCFVPPTVLDTKQAVYMLPGGGQPLIQMVTIAGPMPYCIRICGDTAVSLMSLQVFSTLQISISSFTPALPIRGAGGHTVEPHGSIMPPVTFVNVGGPLTILVNFFVVGLMLRYEAILMSAMLQVAPVPSKSSKSSASASSSGSLSWSPSTAWTCH